MKTIDSLLFEFLKAESTLESEHFEAAAADFHRVSIWREKGIPEEQMKLDNTISDLLKVPRRNK